MSKAFTTENADAPEDDFLPSYRAPELPLDAKNYTTPKGYRRLVEEWEQLTRADRPEVASLAVHAAATSQLLDAQTYKRRLRELDWRIQYLRQRIDHAEVIDPASRPKVEQIFFGATVTYATQTGEKRTVSIVGVEEADASCGHVSYVSPLAKALLRAQAGDIVQLRKPDSTEDLEILSVNYQQISG